MTGWGWGWETKIKG